jgi:probable HAF family extracellular repeat protein
MNHQFDELTKNLAQSVTRRAALKRFGLGLAGVALACFNLANVALAEDATFTTIDYPDAVATLAVGINDSGQIVGRYVDSAGIFHGYLLSDGNFTPIELPGASATRPLGINLDGDIVGHYVSQGQQERGFLLRDGMFTTIHFPNAAHTVAVGINDSGAISGYYVDAKKKTHGFVLDAETFTGIDFPGANYTEAWRVNNSGQIAGRYLGVDGNFHLYRLQNGNFESFNCPGAVETAPSGYSHVGGLNNLGDIVSAYASGRPYANLSNHNVFGNVHGLLLSEGVFTSIDPPAAIETVASGINDSRQVVGVYTDATGRWHGYLWTP